MLLWAFLMFLQARNRHYIPQPWADGFWRLALITILMGPSAGVVSLISARDAIVLEQKEEAAMQQSDTVAPGLKENRKTRRPW